MTNAATDTVRTLSDQVAEEIRVALTRRRMSQRQLAQALNVSPAWLNYRLTGVQAIDVNDMQRIADALGVSVLDLFPRDMVRPNNRSSALPVRPMPERRRSATRPNGRRAAENTRPVSAVPAVRATQRRAKPVPRPGRTMAA